MNIGIIGLGARSVAYTTNLQKYFTEHKICAICDISSERLRNYKEHFFKSPFPECYSDYNELLAREDLDAVIITTPDYVHREIALAAMDRDLHIILEKPIEVTAQRALDIFERARGYKKTFMLGFVLRYTSIIEKIKELIDSGEVGEVVSVTASENLAPAHSSSYMRRWHRYKKYSGGMMNTKCCHDIDVIRFIIGSPKVKKVSAIGRLGIYTPREEAPERCKNCTLDCLYRFNYDGYGSKTRFDCQEDICVYNSEKDVIDSESMLVEFENGVNLAYELAMSSAEETRKGTINCSKATIEYHTEKMYVNVIYRDKRETKTITFEEVSTGHYGGDFGLLNRFFASCEGNICNDAYDGLMSTLVCMAGEESIKSDKAVYLKDYKSE